MTTDALITKTLRASIKYERSKRNILTNKWKMKTIKERFEKKTMPEPNTGCWIWTGCLNNKGYGRINIDGVIQLASRVSYSLYKGDPTNLIVLHTCDNPMCVSPDHLNLGTMSDNTRDMIKKGRGKSAHTYGIKPNKKLTADQVIFIRASDLTYAKLAIAFNVSVGAIGKVKRFESWV